MKMLRIVKNGEPIIVNAAKMGNNEVLNEMVRKYDTPYEGEDLSGNKYQVYEQEPYLYTSYKYEPA